MWLKIVQTNGGVAIAVTNQMQSAPDQVSGSNPISIGGYIMSYASTYRIPLRCLYPEKFCGKLDISPGHPQPDIDFAIDKIGVVDYIDNQKSCLSV